MTAARRLAQVAVIAGLAALAYAIRRAWPEDAPPLGDGDQSW